MKDLLVKQEKYLEAGIHIGTRMKLSDMNSFIYRVRNDGLYILDLKEIDARIRIAGKMLGLYKPEDVLVVASRTYSANSAQKFCDIIGCRLVTGRFIPGMLTNAERDDFIEPKVLLVCDPKGEKQAVKEAGVMGIPVIALCDTDNTTSFVDLVVPCNNKGRRSLALIFYLLAREYFMQAGKISSYDGFEQPIEDFESPTAQQVKEAAVKEKSKKKEKAKETEEPESGEDKGEKEEEEKEEKKPAKKKAVKKKKAKPKKKEEKKPESKKEEKEEEGEGEGKKKPVKKEEKEEEGKESKEEKTADKEKKEKPKKKAESKSENVNDKEEKEKEPEKPKEAEKGEGKEEKETGETKSAEEKKEAEE